MLARLLGAAIMSQMPLCACAVSATYLWDLSLGLISGTNLWDLSLGLISGTNLWDSSLGNLWD